MSSQPQPQLQINNNRIIKFYKENPTINFETTNLLMVELFEKLLFDMKHTTQESGIKDAILSLKNSLMSEPTIIPEFIDRIDTKMTTILFNIENSEKNMKEIKEINDTQYSTNGKIMNDLTELLERFRNNHQKQIGHDNQLSILLSQIFNSGDITIPYPDGNNSGSFLLKRIRKPSILIQNKDQTDNIGINDINCFLQAIEENNCSGIFLSQNSGISLKKDFQIEFQNNNILLFIHNVEYSSIKIETAVNIIDSLFSKLRLLKFDNNNDTSHTIPKDILDTINNEYQLFISQKNAVIDVFKESQKKVLSQIDEIRFPCLDKYLSTKYTNPVIKTGLKCVLCNSYSANNLKALAAHKRGCIRKMKPPQIGGGGDVSNILITNG